MEDIATELDGMLARLRAGYDVAPFMLSLHATARMAFSPLPGDMERLVAQSPDWVGIAPGQGPVWIGIHAENGSAELVLYRGAIDHVLYVLAPA
jgi:hypothetical protein